MLDSSMFDTDFACPAHTPKASHHSHAMPSLLLTTLSKNLARSP